MERFAETGDSPDNPEKRDPLDFVLWKGSESGEPPVVGRRAFLLVSGGLATAAVGGGLGWAFGPGSGGASAAPAPRASAALAARLESSPALAVPKWKQAVALQDALAYDEPPAWYYPIRESLGAAMLLSGDAAGAETVFREGLRRSPNNGRMLFGLLESLKAQGKIDAIAWVQREFEAAWKGADVELRIGDL